MDVGGVQQSPRQSRRRWAWAIVAVAILVVAGVSIYVVTRSQPQSVLPTAWSASGACPAVDCLVAVSSQGMYRVAKLNESMYGDTNYSLQAFNLATGADLWSPVNIYIAQAFGMFESAVENHPPLFVDHDTVSFVVAGSGEMVSGQPAVANLPGCVIYILEWNASTGAFLGAQRTGQLESCLSFVFAIEDQGWVTVAWMPALGAGQTNISIATFSEQNPSPLYSSWTTQVAIGPDNWFGWPLFPLTMADGEITISERAGNDTTAVLSGHSGTVLWQKPLMGWVAAGDNPFGTVDYFDNVARDSGNLVYVSENDSQAHLSELNLSTYAVSELADLPISGYALNLTEVEAVGGGELVVTDAWSGTYYAYSSDGQPLWNRTLSISEINGPSGSSVEGSLYQPLLMGGTDLLGTLYEDDAAGPGVNFTISYSVPILLLNATTGDVTWQTSYTSTVDVSQPASRPPDAYLPIAAVGPYLVYQHGVDGGLSVARLPGIQ